MRSWIEELDRLAEDDTPAVLLTVASVRGSAPREVGAKMIVTETESIGTIGGGQLEYQCIQLACAALRDPGAMDDRVNTRRFALGANCGQCCGGVVEVMFEPLVNANTDWLPVLTALHKQQAAMIVATTLNGPAHKFIVSGAAVCGFPADKDCPDEVLAAARSMLGACAPAQTAGGYLLETLRPGDFQVAIFGAGHVGAATVDVLSRLDCQIRWIDGRRNIFPDRVPQNVTTVTLADPVSEIATMPEGSFFLVMTHSHTLDQEICQLVLARQDFAYCGLIGSLGKRRRFTRRMLEHGLALSLLERLVCPIGVSGIEGKKPVEIAISVSAELLQVRDSMAASNGIVPACREVSA